MWEDENRNSVGYNEEMFEGDAPSDEPRQPALARPAGQDPAALLQRQLAPGEQLVWWGQPKKVHGPRSGMQKMCAVVFLAFACFWEASALQALFVGGVFGVIFPRFGIPFIVVGLKMLFPGLGASRRLRQTVYGVTTLQAISVCGGQVTAWDLDAVTSVEKFYYKDGTGDLVLSNGQVEHYYHNGHSHTRAVTLTFLAFLTWTPPRRRCVPAETKQARAVPARHGLFYER